MKNFTLNAVKLDRKTKTGKRIYKLSGSKACLEFYREMQGEYLREDDNRNPLFFTSVLAQAGTITWNEENERFYLNPDFASEVMIEAALRAFRPIVDTPPTASESDDESDDESEADLAPEPKATPKPRGAKRQL
jgi:hypothetical protein